MSMCHIPNGFQYLARNIFLLSRSDAPLSEACESVWSVSWRYFRRSYDRTKLPRVSAKWITTTTRGCSYGYTDCYVLSAWRSPSSLGNFCLWRWMKSEVYWRKVDTWDELLDRIMDAIARIKERQYELRRATRHVLTRVAKCIHVDGGILANLL
jgi:hypothetical protein